MTHFIRPGSPLDKEAINRGTTVYLVDRVSTFSVVFLCAWSASLAYRYGARIAKLESLLA